MSVYSESLGDLVRLFWKQGLNTTDIARKLTDGGFRKGRQEARPVTEAAVYNELARSTAKGREQAA